MKDSEIDWNKAPEGATHYWCDANIFYKFPTTMSGLMFQNNVWQPYSGHNIFGRSLTPKPPLIENTPLTYTFSDELKIEPQVTRVDFNEDKLVYTQAMCDAGELPSVGMECKVIHNGLSEPIKGVVLCYDDEEGAVVMKGDNVNSLENNESVIRDVAVFAMYNISEPDFKFLPITPPIELIDGKAYQFDHSSIGVSVGFYLKDKDLFDCAGTYYSIESGCTNIKLLEVK